RHDRASADARADRRPTSVARGSPRHARDSPWVAATHPAHRSGAARPRATRSLPGLTNAPTDPRPTTHPQPSRVATPRRMPTPPGEGAHGGALSVAEPTAH